MFQSVKICLQCRRLQSAGLQKSQTQHSNQTLVAKLCPTLALVTPWTRNLPGFSVHGIPQAKILEWVALSATFKDYSKLLGVGNGNPLKYSYLDHSMDRGNWRDVVHGVTKSQTQLSMHAQTTSISHT